jgi:hypothetical protein
VGSGSIGDLEVRQQQPQTLPTVHVARCANEKQRVGRGPGAAGIFPSEPHANTDAQECGGLRFGVMMRR